MASSCEDCGNYRGGMAAGGHGFGTNLSDSSCAAVLCVPGNEASAKQQTKRLAWR